MLAIVEETASVQEPLPVRPASGNPNRLVSLWDIVNHFDAVNLIKLMGRLGYLRSSLAATIAIPIPDWKDKLTEAFSDVKVYCNKVKFTDAELQAGFCGIHVDKAVELDTSTATSELRHIETALHKETVDRRFICVEKDFVKYLDRDHMFGNNIRD